MIYYLLCFFASLFSFAFFSKSYNQSDRFFMSFSFLMTILPLILLSGFRSVGVGTDSYTYVNIFESIKGLHTLNEVIWNNIPVEVGYIILNKVASYFSGNYISLFLMVSIVIIPIYIFVIVKKAPYPIFSFFIFLFMGVFTSHFNIVRQGIALAIFFIAIFTIFEKKIFLFLLLIFVGSLFHKSIIITIPFYFIFNFKDGHYKYLFTSLFFLIVIVFYNQFVDYISNVTGKYGDYSEKMETVGAVFTTLINVISFLWFVIVRKVNNIASKFYDFLCYFYFVNVCFCFSSVVLNIDPSGFIRIGNYFNQVIILLIPMSLMSFKNKRVGFYLAYFSILIMFLYFSIIVNTFASLVPFKFNPILGF